MTEPLNFLKWVQECCQVSWAIKFNAG